MVVCCLPLLYVIWQSRRDNLALHADRVINLPGIAWYGWIDDKNLLLVQSRSSVYGLNISTHVSTPLPHVAYVMQKTFLGQPLSLSPDGKMLVVVDYSLKDGNRFVYIPLDGSAPDRWVKTDGVNCVWLDSESSIVINGIYGRDMRLNQYSRQGVKKASRKIEAVDGPPILWANFLLGVVEGRALSTAGTAGDIPFRPIKKVALFDVNMRDNSPAKSHIVTLPEKATVESMAMSPRSNTIAWLLMTTPEYNNNLLARLYRRLGVLNYKTETAGVWLSNANGEGFQCLGHLSNTNVNFSPDSDSLKWTPDGTHLSFYLNDRMYLFKNPQ